MTAFNDPPLAFFVYFDDSFPFVLEFYYILAIIPLLGIPGFCVPERNERWSTELLRDKKEKIGYEYNKETYN